MIHRLFKRIVYMQAFDNEGGGGGAPEVAAPDVAAVEPSAPVADVSVPDAPKTALEALSNALMSRDELGRFAGKADPAAQPAPAVDPLAKPATPVVQAKPDDITAMPDGLSPKAQERFQGLVSANRELTERFETSNRQVEYVRETFGQHGISQPQFEQAANVLGMMNRGDYRSALKVLDEQRAQIAMALGEPLPGVDALASHPDLRAGVDGLEITEQRAMEIARLRQQTQATERQQQAAQQSQQTAQAEQQAFTQAQTAVDQFCQQMAREDINFPAIEAQLLPALPKLLEGIPTNRWPNVVRTQYDFIKGALRSVRPSTPNVNPLRSTGAASPAHAPKSAYEAAWGAPQPRV